MDEKFKVEQELNKETTVEQVVESPTEEIVSDCLNCGAKLEEGQEFCTKCGMKKGTKKELVCKKCGEVVSLGQKFCPKCGEKVEINIDNIVDSAKRQYKEKVKKLNTKGIKTFAILIVTIAVICFAAWKIMPEIFVSTEELLAQGNYEEAYKKANGEEKKDILGENLIAVLCAELVESYKDPSSFELRDAWIDGDKVVIKAAGKNSYGGMVYSYDYYTYDEEDEEYQLYCSLSSLEPEEYYSFDDYKDKLEKILKNAAREIVKEIIDKDECKLDKNSLNNINKLFENDLVDTVMLLDEVKILAGKNGDNV